MLWGKKSPKSASIPVRWITDYSPMRTCSRSRSITGMIEPREESTPFTSKSLSELFSVNGHQFLTFNTIYQLAEEDWSGQATSLLLVPDLVNFWLTHGCYGGNQRLINRPS